MSEERLLLAELLAKSDDGDFLCGVAEAELQMLMEADAVRIRCNNSGYNTQRRSYFGRNSRSVGLC
jgi:hypothetical protein